MDPATKQYVTFSAILAIIISFIINFMLIEMVKGGFGYGFPINLNELEGFGMLLARVANTLIMGAFLTIPVYLGLMYLQRSR